MKKEKGQSGRELRHEPRAGKPALSVAGQELNQQLAYFELKARRKAAVIAFEKAAARLREAEALLEAVRVAREAEAADGPDEVRA